MRLAAALIRSSVFAMGCAGAGGAAAQALETPLLIAYSTDAPSGEGDPDYAQTIYIAVPETAEGRLDLRLFDPDLTGRHDTSFAPGEPSETRFTLYGGPDAYRGVSEAGADDGFRIAEAVYGKDPSTDDSWVAFASVDPAAGALFGEERIFRFVAKGLPGLEGNIFDLDVTLGGSRDRVRLFTHDVGMRAATPQAVLEIRFEVPDDAQALRIRNFDASGGTISYVGPFRTVELFASENDRWREGVVTLEAAERGRLAAVQFLGGREVPNDLSVAVSVIDEGGRERPVALAPPVRWQRRNARPLAQALASAVDCATIAFDASPSDDEEGGLSYRWSFHDGASATGLTTSKVYEQPGRYPVRLEVHDGDEQAGSGAALEFDVTVPAPPRAEIGALSQTIGVGDPVRLDARGSEPGGEGSAIERVRWTVDGEVVSTDEVATVTFAEPGDHLVRLDVEDDSGTVCAGAHADRVVAVNRPPQADAGADLSARVGEAVSLDGAGSGDRDGSIVAFDWALSDGRRLTGPRPVVAFQQPGRYSARLTVRDSSGADNGIASDSVSIVVEPAADAPPTVAIAGTGSAAVGDTVVLRADATDPEGEALATAWSFEDAPATRGPSVARVYSEPGIYEATASAVEADGAGRASATASVRVARSGNRAPVAVASGPRRGVVGERLIFDAKRSFDPDGRILAYAWRFESRPAGAPEVVGVTALHAFAAPGRYIVTLTVTDDGPAERTARDVIAVDIGAP